MKKLDTNDIKNLTKEEFFEIMRSEVFDNPDFSRQLKETAKKENLPESVVRTVIEKYLLDIASEMVKVKRHKRRIILHGHLNIEILESKYNPFSVYFKKRKK